MIHVTRTASTWLLLSLAIAPCASAQAVRVFLGSSDLGLPASEGAYTNPREWVEVQYMSWGLTRSGAEAPQMSDVLLTKSCDAISAELLARLASGASIAEVKIVLVEFSPENAKGLVVATFTLSQCRVASISASASDVLASESVMLGFRKIEFLIQRSGRPGPQESARTVIDRALFE